MAQCPRCGRHFDKASSVARHLGQPSSRCNTFPSEIVTIAEAVRRAQPNQQTDSEDSSEDEDDSDSENDGWVPHHNMEDALPDHHDDMGGPNNDGGDGDPEEWQGIGAQDEDEDAGGEDEDAGGGGDPPSNVSPIKHKAVRGLRVEEFEGAGTIVGTTHSYTQRFHRARYAKERKTQPYYPFKSRSEWKLALFLLQSDMSMATIDRLLSLKLVRLSFYFISLITHPLCRYAASTCRLTPPKPSGAGRNSFLPVRNG